MNITIEYCGHGQSIGLLPKRIGFTPCACNLIDLFLPVLFIVIFGTISFYQTRKRYDFVFPNFNCLFRTKLVLSFLTILMEITLLLFVLFNQSLRREFVSIISLTSSSMNIIAWLLQTSLMYALHWRALRPSWWNLRTFWFIWFLSQCASMLSFSNILLSDILISDQHFSRMIYFILMAIQFICSACLAILIFSPDDVGDYSPVTKYFPSSVQHSTSGQSRYNFLGRRGKCC